MIQIGKIFAGRGGGGGGGGGGVSFFFFWAQGFDFRR